MTKDTGPTLRIVTMPSDQPEPCDGTYTCPCTGCRGDVDQLVARGPRRTAPLPLKRAA
jgi:hypothetical protein